MGVDRTWSGGGDVISVFLSTGFFEIAAAACAPNTPRSIPFADDATCSLQATQIHGYQSMINLRAVSARF